MMNAPEPKLEHLYQEVILDHNRNPRNFKEIPNPSAYSHGYNPLCGDDYYVYLKVDDKGIVEDIGFQGTGCAISKASSSMLTTLVKGKPVAEAKTIQSNFISILTQDDASEEQKKSIGRLKIFEGVKEFPVRVKCATIAWHALGDALKDVSSKTGGV